MPSCSGRPGSREVTQTQVVESFEDELTSTEAVRVLFQVIRVPKQVYIYIGLAEDRNSCLDSTSMGVMPAPRPSPDGPLPRTSPVTTTIIPSSSKTQNGDHSSQAMAHMLCRKTLGTPVLVTYNIPEGAVADTIKNKIVRHAASLVSTRS